MLHILAQRPCRLTCLKACRVTLPGTMDQHSRFSRVKYFRAFLALWALLSLLLQGACALPASAGKPLFLEDMTSPEVAQAIADGRKTAIIYFGSTEQNGPHMVLGKHNRVAHHLAERLALALGDALIYPVLPLAPTGDPVARSGHMAFAGSISVRSSTFEALAQDIVLSALATGFETVLLLGDHGQGQEVLAALAHNFDQALASHGRHVWHLSAMYDAATGGHAGREDTAMLLATDDAQRAKAGVRRAALAQAGGQPGVEDDPQGATVAEGEAMLAQRLEAALAQLRQLRRADR